MKRRRSSSTVLPYRAIIRRLMHGSVIDDFVRMAEGVPPALTLATPRVCPASLRNGIDDLATTAAWVSDPVRRARPARAEHWLEEQTSHLTFDLGAIYGVCATKANTLKLDDIAAGVSLADVQRQRPNKTPEQLLRSGLAEAFGTRRPAEAIRLGGAGDVYLCNSGGSHRIAAVRAEYRRERRAYPLSLTLHSIEPGEALCAFLTGWEVLAAVIQPHMQGIMLPRGSPRRDRSTTATGWGQAIVAVVRRGSHAADTAEQLIDDGRAFGLRQFLKDQGCRV